SHGDPRDAHQLLLLVQDANVPDLAAPADVQRAGRAYDVAVLHGAYVIRVDFLPDHAISIGIDDERSCRAAERLGQRHRRAAMEDAVRLARAIVDRHATSQVVRAELDELDAQVARQRRAIEANLLESIWTEPDHERGRGWSEKTRERRALVTSAHFNTSTCLLQLFAHPLVGLAERYAFLDHHLVGLGCRVDRWIEHDALFAEVYALERCRQNAERLETGIDAA